eukprot:m.356560 g.356560  ORF g.356560 m.356560 type:complete len:353 (-) comp17581_c0_seq1:295-1353(-)
MEGSGKRLGSASEQALVPVKKAKDMSLSAVTTATGGAVVAAGRLRTSELKAPIMRLTGHQGELFCGRYNPNGECLASAGFDRQIMLWKTLGECENYGVLEGHGGAVLGLSWASDETHLYSASSDKTCAVWDTVVGERVRKLKGHSDIVNAVCAARNNTSLFVSGSDDNSVRVWDARSKNPVTTFDNGYQVTAVAFHQEGDQVISAGIDNDVKVWDIKTGSMAFAMQGHTNTVTGMALSPNGKQLLTTAMDNTVRIWDAQPFVSGSRMVKSFSGAQHSSEMNLIKCAWTPDGKHIGSGSANRNLYIWNVSTEKVVYALPGHAGSVNDVDFHPSQPIVLTASSDKTLFQGELEL